jgi:AcrR family transcriptional regulator
MASQRPRAGSAALRTGAAAALRRAPRARTRDPAEKRARAMEAARRLFSERGYAATTTADVARHAGVSEGTLFHHFGSKEGLLAAVAGEYGRGLAAAMFEAAPLGPTPPSADEMLRRAFAFVREQGTLARLLVLTADPITRHTARQATRVEIVGALARGFADWSARGLLRPLDPQIAAELLFALVEAALTECFVHGAGEREEDYLRETVRCVEGALALPHAPSTPPEERTRS